MNGARTCNSDNTERAVCCAGNLSMLCAIVSVQVLLPLREISWDWIPNTAAALSIGQELTCVVTNLQAPPKTKVSGLAFGGRAAAVGSGGPPCQPLPG